MGWERSSERAPKSCRYSDLFETVINLAKVNDQRFINKHFERINSILPEDGKYIGCFETLASRRIRKRISSIKFINDFYFAWEFVFKRVLPKLNLTKKCFLDNKKRLKIVLRIDAKKRRAKTWKVRGK